MGCLEDAEGGDAQGGGKSHSDEAIAPYVLGVCTLPKDYVDFESVRVYTWFYAKVGYLGSRRLVLAIRSFLSLEYSCDRGDDQLVLLRVAFLIVSFICNRFRTCQIG